MKDIYYIISSSISIVDYSNRGIANDYIISMSLLEAADTFILTRHVIHITIEIKKEMVF